MSLSFISVDLNTGAIMADLTDLKLQGPMCQTLMRYETQTAELPLDTESVPSDWKTATREGASVVVCVGDDKQTPLWGGLVVTNEHNETASAYLSLATLEAYLDRVYVGNETFTATDQNAIVQTLVNKYVGRVHGLPIRVQVVGGTGVIRDRKYLDTDDKTLYSILGELSGVINGPEWTIGWEYANSKYTPVLYVGSRIGVAAPAGLNPDAVFNMPGPVSKYRYIKSYAAGAGANSVIATSTGIGGARPQSAAQTPANGFDGRPIFEYRFSPSTQITSTDTLTAHAARALGTMQAGARSLTIESNRMEGPKLVDDWNIGDDIGFDITSSAWPNGRSGTARAVGWQMDNNTIIPVLDTSTLGEL